MRADDAGERHPAARQFLEDDGERRVVHRRAAVLLGDVQPEEPQLLHGLDERVGILAPVLHLGRDRHDVALDELADGLNDELLIVASRAWHPPSASVALGSGSVQALRLWPAMRTVSADTRVRPNLA